jgi:predicted nuclease of predicted toxin-antitoxin system
MSERFLANENFPAAVVRWLRNQGHDVLYAAETMAAAEDRLVLQTALAEDRVLLTFDNDFGELVFRHRAPPAPGVVLFRLHQLPPDDMIAALEGFFSVFPVARLFHRCESRSISSDAVAFVISPETFRS